MGLQIGDPIFARNGIPGVIKERSDAKESITSDVTPGTVKEDFRHGYIKGLAPQARQDFNNLMDKVHSLESGKEKVSTLQQSIEELEVSKEKTPEKLLFLRYLKSEMFHLMRVHNIRPQEYSIPYYQVSQE